MSNAINHESQEENLNDFNEWGRAMRMSARHKVYSITIKESHVFTMEYHFI